MERSTGRIPERVRRLSIVTSPPKGGGTQKNTVELDLVFNEEEGRSVKRARVETAPSEGETRKDSATMLLRKVAKVVKSIETGVRQLHKVIQEHPNTQKGVKEAAARIRSDSSLLNTAEIRALLETACILGDRRDAEKIEAETQTESGSPVGESERRGVAESTDALQQEQKRDEKLEKLSREFNGKVEAIMKAIRRIEGGGRGKTSQEEAETEEPTKRLKKQQKTGQEVREEDYGRGGQGRTRSEREDGRTGQQAGRREQRQRWVGIKKGQGEHICRYPKEDQGGGRR